MELASAAAGADAGAGAGAGAGLPQDLHLDSPLGMQSGGDGNHHEGDADASTAAKERRASWHIDPDSKLLVYSPVASRKKPSQDGPAPYKASKTASPAKSKATKQPSTGTGAAEPSTAIVPEGLFSWTFDPVTGASVYTARSAMPDGERVRAELPLAVSLHRLDAEHPPPPPSGQLAQEYFMPMLRGGGVQAFVSNADVRDVVMLRVSRNAASIPVTVSDAICLGGERALPSRHFWRERSYVVSLMSHYVGYGVDEIGMHIANPVARVVLQAIVLMLGGLFWLAGVDRAALVNNYLLSTNLYPTEDLEGMEEQFVEQSTAALTNAYPSHAVVFRSVEKRGNAALVRALERSGYTFVFARQINYVLPTEDGMWSRHRDLKRDLKVLRQLVGLDMEAFAQVPASVGLDGVCASRSARDTPYECAVLGPQDASAAAGKVVTRTLERVVQLYRMVYYDKYSPHNPQPTVQYLRHLVEHGLMDIVVFRKAGGEPWEIDGFNSLQVTGSTMCTPMMGYDTAQGANAGVYRALSVLALLEARRRGLSFNWSGGVSGFKRNRGATTLVEYNAAYVGHLSLWRRVPWHVMRIVTERVVLPILRRKRDDL